MTYRNAAGVRLDLSSAGRGMQQALLLLAHLEVNPQTVLLLDEPDAHLEILRQRQIYSLMTTAAAERGSQVIAASHSEVVLNEAADRDTVVAFVGSPHRMDDRGSQVLKSLKSIGFEQYYQAETRGWVLYLEGSTDLEILRTFAERLNHEAAGALRSPFVKYVGNNVAAVAEHFFGLKEAKSDLRGLALWDRLDAVPSYADPQLLILQWKCREIENYLSQRETLLNWAQADAGEGTLWRSQYEETMERSIETVTAAMETLDQGGPWDCDTKVSDYFLTPLFRAFYKELGLPNQLSKTDFHVLARHVPDDLLDNEVVEVLDKISQVANQATSP